MVNRLSRTRRRSLLVGMSALLVVLAAAVVAGASTGHRAAVPSAPPVPPCDAKPDYGCFKPAAPEPGTDIPKVKLTFSMRPAADNSFYIVALRKGWFNDVGINVNPFKATNENAIPLALKNQNNIGAMFGGSVIQVLNTHKNLKMIMFTDDFVGHWMWANPKLHLKTYNQYVAQGLSVKQALQKTLAPMIKSGQKLATSPLLDTRPLINTAFGLAGLKPPPLLLVDDPENEVLWRSGRLDFTFPVIASANLTLLNAGWTPLVGIADLLKTVKAGAASPVENIVFTVGVMANRNYIEGNPNTTLRFVSGVFRTIDEILADKGKPGGLMDLAAPFVNSYGGTKLSARDLFKVYSILDPLSSWDSQTKYFVNKADPRYYVTAYNAFINASIKAKVLKPGVGPDDGIWASQIWSTLRWYQQQSDTLFASLKGKTLSASQRSLVAQARKYYGWHDYLDSFRLAKAAAT